jgi:hypothetical protein
VHLVAFAWVELIDVTNYLNHYYLYTLLGALLLLMPLGRAWGLDARRLGPLTHGPAWMVWLVRFQVGVVYTYAGLAKAGSDWLLHGQPLNLWLSARQDFPLIGPLFDEPATALAFAWAGFLHDLLVPWLLLWRRTRVPAYVLLLGFHACTHLLFNIGMFPFIMTIAATVFFDPSWPRRLLQRVRGPMGTSLQMQAWMGPTGTRARVLGWGIALYCMFQMLMPLRAHLYGGNVLWHEQGMRWSWRVMVREKNGTVTYRVRTGPDARERHMPASIFLTPDQEREMSGQPDMILALAHHIAKAWRSAGHDTVEVRVDAICSLNGRVPARLIDPTVDLARVEDTLTSKDWILPEPPGPPPILRPIRLPTAVASHTPVAPNGNDHVAP